VTTYEFTLTFDIIAVSAAPDDCVEALGAHGCDDALVGIGRTGRIALRFSRAADSPWQAVTSALRDVRSALPGAALLEASPDFVGVTEVAQIVGRSRQNIRQLMLSCGASAPPPVHEGQPSIWHLADVLTWLRDSKRYVIDDDLIAMARTNMQLNLAVAQRAADPSAQDAIAALV
jgi:predicted DNA-binding transcriptional regulator AlpA